MVNIICNPDGTIKSFMEDTLGQPLLTGETTVCVPVDMSSYAARFMVSCSDRCCSTVRTHVGSPAVVVTVHAPGFDRVSVDVNGEPRQIFLASGRGTIEIPTDHAARYLLSPCDRKTFCAAGSGILTVEVIV